jgi:hypothetical protein
MTQQTPLIAGGSPTPVSQTVQWLQCGRPVARQLEKLIAIFRIIHPTGGENVIIGEIRTSRPVRTSLPTLGLRERTYAQ